MSPRKRIRTDRAENSSCSSLPLAVSQPRTTSQASTVSATASTTLAIPPIASPSEHNSTPRQASTATPKQLQKKKSWYDSWPRKSSASTQVARETILGGTSKPDSTTSLSRYDTRKNSDNTSNDGNSAVSTSLSKIPEGDQGVEARQETMAVVSEARKSDDKPASEEAMVPKQEETARMDENPPATPPPPENPIVPTGDTPRHSVSSAWLGWFGRTSGSEPTPTKVDPARPVTPQDETHATSQGETQPMDIDTTPIDDAKHETEQTQVKSWLPFWSSSLPKDQARQPDQTSTEPGKKKQEQQPSTIRDSTAPQEDTVMEDVPPLPATTPMESTSASTWAFWSRDSNPKSKDTDKKPEEPGQFAAIGEGTECHPKAASGVQVKGSEIKEARQSSLPEVKMGKPEKTKRSKRVRPQSVDLDASGPSRPDTPSSEHSATGGKAESSKTSGSTKGEPSPKVVTNNLLLPSFRSTYRLKESPSILHQIAELLLRTKQSPTKHVFLSQDHPKIQKALAIGVHGLFPATYLRPMIGQPTGTSIKFANHCAEGIRRWADSHGCEECEIEKVALEGEGKIADRVENLWKLLLNWIDQIRNADLIVLACHSQGVPVAIMLVAKLIDLGIITTPRIGVCAMAGVSLGPFPDYKSGLLMGSAAELWEFSNPESDLSKRYEHSLQAALNYGVRITYVGSIDDQVVPMESAIYSPASHPYIYRAAFIDGRVHAPDFIAHLVGFACKLRNLGISDHGLVRELSLPLAGSLYSGEGHSRLYDDEQVYDLAVTHTLETTSVGRVACEITKYEGLANPNPYHLPWIMRGLLEEDFVKTELTSETAELLRQFDDWKPVTKALKDVKYRLEAVRSKL